MRVYSWLPGDQNPVGKRYSNETAQLVSSVVCGAAVVGWGVGMLGVRVGGRDVGVGRAVVGVRVGNGGAVGELTTGLASDV